MCVCVCSGLISVSNLTTIELKDLRLGGTKVRKRVNYLKLHVTYAFVFLVRLSLAIKELLSYLLIYSEVVTCPNDIEFIDITF